MGKEMVVLKEEGISDPGLLNVPLVEFSEDELSRIHEATVDVLENTGVHVPYGEAMDIFEQAGAEVNREEKTVRIPEDIVQQALKSAPSQVLLAGRRPELDILLGGEGQEFCNFGGAVMVEDVESGEIRESALKDVYQTAVFCDSLDVVGIYSSACIANDAPKELMDLYEAVAFFAGAQKHCQHSNLISGEHTRIFAEMAAVVAGGMAELQKRPVASVLVSLLSPLDLGKAGCEIIIESARHGLPITIMSMPYAGLSAPITLAGAVVVHNAEVLAGIVLHQLVCQGAPVIYGSSSTTFDMMAAQAAAGSPELALFSAAIAQLARYYNLPSYVAGG